MEIALKLAQSEWPSFGIDGQGCRAGCVDPDADDGFGINARFSQGPGDGCDEAIHVVLRILAGKMGIARIDPDPIFAGRIVPRSGSHFFTGVDIDNESTHALRAVVDAKGIPRFRHNPF